MNESAFGIDHGGFSKGLTPRQGEAKLVLDRLAARRKGGFGFKTTTPQDAMPLSKPFTAHDGIPGQHVNLSSGGAKQKRVAKAFKPPGLGAMGAHRSPIGGLKVAGQGLSSTLKTAGNQFQGGFQNPLARGVLKPTMATGAGQKTAQGMSAFGANKKPLLGGAAAGGALGLGAGRRKQ